MQSTHLTKNFNRFIRYTPLMAYIFVYTLTCLIAAQLFYFEYRPFVALVEYFSGVTLPQSYSSNQEITLLALLWGAPLLFSTGFLLAIRTRIPHSAAPVPIISNRTYIDISAWFPATVFSISSALGALSLFQAGAYDKLGDWGDYGSWVEGRWALFSSLGFFDFVNLYLVVPVAAAWVMLITRGSKRIVLVSRLLPLAVVIVLMMSLFQKKALLTSLIIIFGALFLEQVLSGRWNRRLGWFSFLAVATLASTYFVLVVLPVYSETSSTAATVLAKPEVTGKHTGAPATLVTQTTTEAGLSQSDNSGEQKSELVVPKASETTQPGQPLREVASVPLSSSKDRGSITDKTRLYREVGSLIGSDRNIRIGAYAILAPMTRTSLPAMYYPIIFPMQHDYYGIDFGQDILGFGEMPDDNLVVWKHMYPTMSGSAGAPFQFTLYCQVGLVWSLILSIFVGALIGLGWRCILTSDANRTLRSLIGSVLVLFSIYLGIDSVRGSLFSSYGIIWALLFIAAISTLYRLLLVQHGGLFLRFCKDKK